MAGDFGGAVGGEGAIFGSGAGRKSFGVEFRDGVVAYKDTRLVLVTGLIGDQGNEEGKECEKTGLPLWWS